MNFNYLKDFMDRLTSWRIPGNSISVCLDGKEVFDYRSGYSDLENKITMEKNMLFNIYSCSKIATVTAALSFMNRDIFCLMIRFMSLSPNLRKCTYKMRTVSLKRRKMRLL